MSALLQYDDLSLTLKKTLNSNRSEKPQWLVPDVMLCSVGFAKRAKVNIGSANQLVSLVRPFSPVLYPVSQPCLHLQLLFSQVPVHNSLHGGGIWCQATILSNIYHLSSIV